MLYICKKGEESKSKPVGGGGGGGGGGVIPSLALLSRPYCGMVDHFVVRTDRH